MRSPYGGVIGVSIFVDLHRHVVLSGVVEFTEWMWFFFFFFFISWALSGLFLDYFLYCQQIPFASLHTSLDSQ